MNFKMKMLAAAVTLAVAGTANAASDFASGDSSLFLNVRDNNAGGASYTLDLGSVLSTFVDGNYSWTDTSLTSFLTGKDNLSWSVIAGDNVGSAPAGELHYMSTATDATAADTALMVNDKLVPFTNVGGYSTGVTQAMQGASQNFWIETDSALSSFYTTTYDNWQGNATFDATEEWNGVGSSSMQFFSMTTTGGTGARNNGSTTLVAFDPAIAGTFTLSSTGLTYGAPSAVPVPAAVWLLGSALVGLAGVGRRRNQTA